MQGISIECENIFRARTSTFQTSIDSTSLVNEMLQNCHVVSSYKFICYDVEQKVPDEICFNILEKMLMLFTRVWTFSYAKDIRDQYKSKKKQRLKASLRTEKASSSIDGSMNCAVPDMDSKNCQNGYFYSHKWINICFGLFLSICYMTL